MHQFDIFRAVLFVGFVTCLSVPAFSGDMVQKTFCMSAASEAGHIDQVKKQLLVAAKRQAVSEIFGEYVKSFSKVVDFALEEDRMTASSAGFVRVSGDPKFYNGNGFGEVCVKIKAYATQEDKKKFKAVTIVNKKCLSDASLSTTALKKKAQEQAVLNALINYEGRLKGLNKKNIISLIHKSNYAGSAFIADTAMYCSKFKGIIYPVEIQTAIDNEKKVKYGHNSLPGRWVATSVLENGKPVSDFKKYIITFSKNINGFTVGKIEMFASKHHSITLGADVTLLNDGTLKWQEEKGIKFEHGKFEWVTGDQWDAQFSGKKLIASLKVGKRTYRMKLFKQ